MKKSTLLIAAVFSALVSSVFISCKYDLIPEPTIEQGSKKNPADYANAILPPTKVAATHGGYRNITLEWSPVENAVRYQIYYAKTPFDDFEKLVETSNDATTYNVEAPAGSTYYFYIKAVNYYDTVSAESVKVKGSSLAVPIITSITASDNAQSVLIEWWMDNCFEDTYQSAIEYIVKAYDSNKQELPGSAKTLNGACRETSISGLSPSTKYYFSVEAKLKDSDQKSEISDVTTKETAHSIIPSSVDGFTVTQGISSSEIEISWKLPKGADYFDAYSNTYSVHPVMFVVQRKEFEKADTDYEEIAVIGIQNISGGKDLYSHPYKMTHSFDCEAETANPDTGSLYLKINGGTATDYIDANNTYPKYKPGTTLTLVDKNKIERGKQYTYRIISVTDDTTKVYQADSSISSPITGWLISAANFKASASYLKNDAETEYTDIYVNFNLSFTPFTTSYNYILTQTITPFKTDVNPNPVPGTEEIIIISDSISSITGKELNYNIATLSSSVTEWKGSYKYKLYITDKTISSVPSSTSEYYEKIESAGTITVTNDMNSMPKINVFNVADGYSDHFALTWDYNENYSYTISWIPYEGNIPGNEESLLLRKDDMIISADNTTATFNHNAVSGDMRTYCLTAENGLPTSKFFTNAQNENIMCKTLGTAAPEMAAPDYKKITVSWPAVQMATSYELSAKYKNNPDVDYDDAAAALGELLTETTPTLTPDPVTGKITYEISEIAGYNNSKISGLPIDFTIKAINSVDSTSVTSKVLTLGPALALAETGKTIKADRMSLTWNKIEGADKYLVYRVLYTDKSETAISTADKYIVSEETITGDQDIDNRATISYNSNTNKFCLTDIQQDANEIYGYQLNQEKISWGLPFGYVVLPLKSDGTKTTFTFKDDDLLTLNDTSAVVYDNIEDKRTCTYGYGMNISAKKSVSASKIDINWEEPNSKGLIPTVYRKPFQLGASPEYGKSWEKVITLSEGKTSYSDVINKDSIASAFVYCIQYEAESGSDIVLSYRKKLLESLDSVNSPTEPLNKGYLLALKGFSAEYGGNGTTSGDASYYQENVNWSNTWDYDERALGPDSFTIDLKNKNLSSTKNWVSVAEISIAGNVQSINANTTHADTSIEVMAANNGITLKPTGLSAGTAQTTTGLLHVLRDAKHYYSANLKRGAIIARQAEDESVYAYRQISPEELTKAAMLTIADAFNGTKYSVQTGQSYIIYDEIAYNTPGYNNTGSFMWKNGYDQITFAFNNYQHIFVTTPTSEELLSPLLIKECNYTEVGEWNNNKSYQLRSISSQKKGTPSNSNLIKVTVEGTGISLSSYNGILGFSGSDSVLYIELTQNKTKTLTKSFSKAADVKEWNPMHIGGNSYQGTTANTYWWN